jgi:hypothetical protein
LGLTTINNEVGNHGKVIDGRDVKELDLAGIASTKVPKGRRVPKKNQSMKHQKITNPV